MCLAVPAKVISIDHNENSAQVSMLGNVITANISLLENIRIDDYLMVHAGFAIQKYDYDEAQKTLELIKQMSDMLVEKK